MEATGSPDRLLEDANPTQQQNDLLHTHHDPAGSAHRTATVDPSLRPELIPETYLEDLPRLRRLEDEGLQEAFLTSTRELARSYVRLVADRADLAKKLACAREAVHEAEYRMMELEKDHQEEVAKLNMQREKEDADHAFRQSRARTNPSTNQDQTYIPMSTSNGNFRMPDSVSNGVFPSIDGQTSADPSRQAPVSATEAVVVDHTGKIIGPIQPLQRENLRSLEIMKLPIQHQRVVIRQGRDFDDRQLDIVHDPANDIEASKWLGLMIQATGEQQQQGCTTCSNQDGIFSQCIIVPSAGTLFPRCGNCEWERLGCDGAIPADNHPRRQSHTATPTPSRVSSGFTAVNNPAQTDDIDAPTSDSPSRTRPRKTLPNGRAVKKNDAAALTAADAPESAENAAAATSPGTQNDASDPSTPTSASGQEPEITRERLELRHDGTVFLEPLVMEGVPVDKIDPAHPYWDPEWRLIEDIIKPKLEDWRNKLEAELNKKQDKNEDKSARFLANRQVNRGNAVLDYLKDGSIHPYQLVRKELIHNGFTNYDTIYRLIATLSELKKFNLGITPLEWMRQRVQEVYVRDPDSFRLEIMVKHMYHDTKLTDLRVKNGYGNIGRPSGLKAKSKRLPSRKTKPEAGEKRKSNPGSARTSPKKLRTSTAQATYDEDSAGAGVGGNPPSPGLPLTAESLQSLDAGPETHTDEDAESQYTNADSYCGAETKKWDWRLAQVKTTQNCSSNSITQYWNFKPDDDIGGGGKFEHQVLREVNPVSWGVYKDPVNFHVHTEQITKVDFCKESLMIAVRVKENGDNHGDTLARFKRPRTMNRWLKFAEERQIELKEFPRDYLDETWMKMKAPELQETDSDSRSSVDGHQQ